MSVAKSWLWPDHAISKGESRSLREEHNATVNALVELAAAADHVTDCVAHEAVVKLRATLDRLRGAHV